jgi:hypothetical protein
VTTDLRGQLDAAGVSGIRPFDVFQPTTTKLPNEIGFIVPEDEIAKLGSMKDATQRIIPRQRYMATEFPFRNRLSFIVGYCKVDPALAKYRKQRSYGTDLLPVFRTSPSMISDERKGKRVCRRAGTQKRR